MGSRISGSFLQDVFMELANAWIIPYKQRSAHERYLTYCGICWGVSQIFYIHGKDSRHVYAKICSINPSNWPERNEDGDLTRAFFCLFLAQMPAGDLLKFWKSLSYVYDIPSC